jgi:Mycothiol maleylpyruvate isomerase N-terminal domain
MENSRFLECLAADYGRIRDIVPGHLEGRVPSCPEWTVADLTRHVGQVYLHKVEGMRTGVDEPPAALLRWVWNREAPGEPSGVAIEGTPEALAEFRRCVVISTQ